MLVGIFIKIHAGETRGKITRKAFCDCRYSEIHFINLRISLSSVFKTAFS